MNSGDNQTRVLILANMQKHQVVEALRDFLPWLRERAEIVAESDTCNMTLEQAANLPDADLAIVLGGDGTMLSQARIMIDRHIPLLGVNFGKLGFIAEFSIETVRKYWDDITQGRISESERLLIQIELFPAGSPEWGINGDMPEPLFRSIAMNDLVVTSGPPYRMIEIELAIEPRASGTSETTITGDGIIIATPTGSTAYNVSAGGPIVSPNTNCLCVSALLPHTLAFRPIVYSATCETWLAIQRANEGTTLVIDGQISCAVEAGQQIRISKYPKHITLIHNPEWNYWKMLAHKMRWGARPRNL